MGKTLRLQSLITSALDASSRDQLRKHLEDSGNYTAVRRIEELSDKEVHHGWLWHLSKHHGPVLSNEEFLETVRVRLGCAGPTEPVPCARCGECLFDSAGSHAACCAIAESTRGHYGVVKQLLSRVQQCDPSAETEVAGLIPGTNLRPADILTQRWHHVPRFPIRWPRLHAIHGRQKTGTLWPAPRRSRAAEHRVHATRLELLW